MRSRLVSSVLRFACIVCAWSAPLAAVVATPQTWNPTSAFSITNGNPNGVWSYGWMDTGFTTFTPFANQSSQSGSDLWYGWGGDFTPSIWLNTGGAPHVGIPAGGIALHPGNGNEPAVLRWTAPLTATVRVAGQFLAGDSGTMQVAVRHKNAVRFSATDAGAFDVTLNVTVGESVDFAVFGGYAYGNTGLQATITETIATVPLTTLDTDKIALGTFDAGTVLRIGVTGSGEIAPRDWTSKPDGSLDSAATGVFTFANVGATYPNVSGFPAGNGLNNFPGGGANYDHNGTGWPFAGKQTTDTADPAAIRFGALVGTYAVSPTRNDWFPIGLGGTFTVPAGGGTLSVAVNESFASNNTGSYTVSLAVAPANDSFDGRAAITGTSASVTGNNVGGAKESSEPNHAGNAGGASSWWTWTAPKTGIVDVSTIGSGFDTLLGVYTGTAVGSLTTVASDDNSGPGGTSKLSFNATAGTAYQIAVDGSGGTTGPIVLNLGYAYRFTTLAGTAGTPGATDATGPAARFSGPNDIVIDSSGNAYVGEAVNHTIRKITPDGIVTTLVGAAGLVGTADGTGSAARFRQPLGLALDGEGNLLVADYENHAIRKITPAGVVTTFAGLAGAAGTVDGTAADARFNFPVGLAVDGSGNVFVADAGNHVIRKITVGGAVTTFAGTMGVSGSADGAGTAAKFNQPYRIAIDSGGNLVVADTFNHTVRRITAAGVVTTLAGTAGVAGVADGAGSAARFNKPYGVVFGPHGNIVVADYLGHTVRMVSPGGVVTTLAGVADTAGTADGSGSAARFHSPTGIARDTGGALYVADFGNNTIRRGVPAYTPVIASFSPQTVAAGMTVTITGTNFTAASAVAFNGLAATSFNVTSDGAISAVVPAGVTAGAISVVTPAGMATSAANFTVGSPPTIASFSPNAFAPGMTVTLTGTNLGGATAVTLNGANVGSFSVNGAGTQVTFVAPNGVTAGLIAVLTPAGTATSGSNYVVRTPVVSSAFSADAGGWTVTSFVDPVAHNYAVNATYAVAHNVVGGNPGGYVSISDPDDTYFYFTAPAAYLGNRTAALGGVLVYDLIYPSGVIDIQTADVIVTGNGQRLVWKRDPAIVPTSEWQTVSVPLAPNSQWRKDATNGALAGVSDFQNVFGNLTGIHVRGEYTLGTETPGLDNVVMALPVPTTPHLANFTPSTVSADSTVTLFGGGFTGATAVTFNGTVATSFTVLSDLAISAVVPGGVTPGTIAVTTPVGTATSGNAYTVGAPPVISAFTPNTLASGITVTISGSGFLGATAVRFNGVNATNFTTAETQITASFPAGATAGTVSVTTPAGIATSGGSYTVTTAPIITAVSPSSGGVGSVVTVSGANFGTISGFSPVVTVNGAAVTQRAAAAGGFRFVVPAGATTGPIAITVGGVAATSAPTFTVETTGTPPANDNFTNAQVIEGAGGTLTADNLFATKESGEPAHGTTGGASVWFRWTAPSSGPYFFSQGGSVIGAFLAIYEGNAVNALTLKAAGKPGNTAFLTGYGATGLVATAGTTYYIAVDGQGGTRGQFTLQWGQLGAPTIASFTPSSVYAGGVLTITGANFTSNATVTVAGVPVIANVTSSTSITVGSLPAIPSTGPVVVTTAAGTGTSESNFTVPGVPAGGGRALIAQSVRGNAPVQLSFMIEGLVSKQMLIRAVGPKLGAFGIGGFLADPRLELFTGTGFSYLQNDDWSGALTSAFSSVGAFALDAGSKDAAALVTLTPGTYTVRIDGVDGGAGQVLAEIYDADTTHRIPYLSTMAHVGSGGNILIVGIVVAGTAPQRLLVRGVGPALAATGLADTLSNPAISVVAGNGTVLATNDNWGSAGTQPALAGAIQTAGLMPLADGSNDAALLIDVVPGNYTVQVSGVGGATGRALFEVAQIDGSRAPVLPALIAPTQTAAVSAGANVTFAAPAVGRPTFQWSKGGTPIGGATGAALPFTGVTTEAAGNYTVAMTGAGTTTTSVNYVLDVAPPATIATVPANGTVVAGSSIALTAQPVGAGPFTYQWRKFGQAISGATNASFTLPAATMFDAGFYDVAIAPSGGSAVVSAPVQVTVHPAGAPLNTATVVPTTTFGTFVEYGGGELDFLVGGSDGKIYVSGYFSSIDGASRRGFARLLADGSVDPSFVPTSIDSTVWAVAVQPDGKVLVGGDFYLIGGRSGPGLARLNADGSLDYSFRPVGLTDGAVYAIALQPDGKMVIGGSGFEPGGHIQRLNADGSRDATFATGYGFDDRVYALLLQPDGKIVAGGPFNNYNGTPAGRIARLNTDGSRDTAFAPGLGFDNRVSWMARQSDGKIVVAGEFSTFDGATAGRIARLNPADGSADPAFAAAVGTGFGGGHIDMIALQGDGKILAGGTFTTLNGATANRIARLLPTGAPDPDFAVGAGSSRDVRGLAVVAGGAIFAETDSAATFDGTACGPIIRLSPGGVRDTGYAPPVREPGYVYALAPAPGGKWMIGGDFEFVNGVARNNLARLNADGSLDAGFGIGTGLNGGVEAILVQPDGRVLVGGGFTAYNGSARSRLVRLTDSGGLDGTFDVGDGFNSNVSALALQADGRVLVGGTFSGYRGATAVSLVRLHPDGSTDTTFGTPGAGFNGGGAVRDVAVLANGDIYVAGDFTHHGGTAVGRVARLNADGTLDTAFAPGSGFDARIHAIAVQPDGRVIVGGQFGSFNGTTLNRIARLNPNGTRDESFATTGFSGTVYDVALQADGRIMAAGYIYRYGTDPTDLPGLVRLNADGTRDYGFVLPAVPSYDRIEQFHFTDSGGLIYVGGESLFPSRATAGVTLLAPALVPVIAQQPAAAVALTAGQAGVSLSVTANNAVAYQWRRDGVPIPGAYGPTYGFPAATMGMAGRYDVMLTSASGAVATSGASTVTVAPSAYPATVAVDAAFDLAFERELFDAGNYPVTAIVALPGGKFIVAGPFSRIGNTPRSRLARFNADGTLDVAWTPAPVVGQIDALAVQGDGKILLGGTFFRVGADFRNGLARLNADGTLDTTAFAGPAPGSVQALAVLPDGKILAGGAFPSVSGGIDRTALARFSAEGVFDPAFNASIGAGGSVRALAVQTVGGAPKIVIGGTFATVGGTARGNVARLNADGSLDTAFSSVAIANGTDGPVNALAIDSGNAVLVGGVFSNFSGTAARALVRLAAADGAPDAAFTAAAGGAGFASGTVIHALAVMADGKIAVGSNDTEFNGIETGALLRLTAAGAPDITGFAFVNAAVQALAAPRTEDGGGVILGGSFDYVNESTVPRLARLTSGWVRDPAVVHTFYVPATVRALAHGLSGDVYVGGDFTHVGGQARSALARLLPGGAFDAAFNADDYGFQKGATVTGLAPVGDGRMTVIGSFSNYRDHTRVGLVRILPDGARDPAFDVGYGLDQPPAAVLALPGGRVLVAGAFTSFKGTSRNGLAAIMPDGSLDPSYLNPVAPIPGGDLVLARQNNDRVLIGGNFTSFAGTSANRLVRLHANGGLDTDFTAGVGIGPSHAVNALAVLPDGNILAAGGFTSWGENTAYRFIARLNSGGGIDGTFVPPAGSFGSAGFGIQSILVQPDGRTLVRGLTGLGIPNTFGFGRLAAGGAADATFAVGGIASIGSTDRPMLLLGDGSLLVGVSGTLVSDTAGPRHGLARLAPASAPTIAAHPQSQVAIAGQTVTFSVAVSGAAAPAYQWRRNTVAINGATSATLVLPAVTTGSIGTYDVLVTVGGGTVIPSNPAFLAIGPVASAGAVERGGSVSFGVDVAGLPSSTFQWQRGGVNLPGETGATLVVTNANDSSVGTYRVIVSNSIGSVTSGGAPLVLLQNSLLALSARHRVPRRGEVSASFTIQGSQPKRVLIRGVGPALAALEIGDRLTDPQLRVYDRTGTQLAANDDWGTGPANPVGATPVFAAGSKDAAIELTLGAGTYTAVLNGADGAGGVAFIQIYDRDADARPRLTMLTTRGHVGTGENVVTVGFTVGGNEPRKLLFRAPGWRLLNPSRERYESGILRDPMIGVYSSDGGQLAFNDDWNGTSQELEAVAATGAQPFNDDTYDATVLIDLAPGNYTAQLLGYSSQTGESLLEIFEVDAYLAATAPPALTWVPSDQPVLPGGGGAVFSATAAGKPGVSFQWRRNGTPIPGATRNLLDFPTVTDSDVATAGVPNVYDVVATNTAGSVTSPGRRLRVLPEFHSADTNRDSRIGLFELTRVIELYNHRSAGVRTGEYRTQAGTEDGYRPGAGAIAAHHSADWNRDGRVGLDELLRVIELYNVTEGPGEARVRTGRYLVSGTSEDGFEPAAVPEETNVE